ncbi:hypothetical protein HK102_008057 [Quaeritorhiza haematococci]|nr:hypothetical protein HK102_008057 [Quaeritorhiza haematococci]
MKLKMPPHELSFIDERRVSRYIQVVKSWIDCALNSFPPWTPLDRIEHRLFRLFVFDVVEALPYFADAEVREGQAPNEDRIGDLQKKAEKQFGAPDPVGASPQPELDEFDQGSLNGITTSTPSNMQKQSARFGGTIQRRSRKPVLPPELVTYVLQHLDASVASADAEFLDVDGFEYLMRLRGPQLVALKLGDEECAEYMDPRLIRSVTTHCRTLQYLCMCFHACDMGTSLKGDILDLLQQCGQTLS